MMGIRQEFKSAAEYDVVYNRKVYCYLVNDPSQVRWWKRYMRRRRRQEAKRALRAD
jgi:hypothetical protein